MISADGVRPISPAGRPHRADVNVNLDSDIPVILEALEFRNALRRTASKRLPTTRDDLIARLKRSSELEVSGDDQAESDLATNHGRGSMHCSIG